ncbi:hypothetical protein [Nitrospira lenta]|uniref:EVE domain-containing protein n=1 Tax=Nitrospira lenta TaxID=1436998 RepID=A0A330LHJ4_9BACT|nr:hypothetical protein [Nitrospira lenta]SPP66677.1 conserved hypothetical protein [Nitrospira lenta]
MSHFLFVAGTLRERSSPESASLQLTHGLWGCCSALIRDNLTTFLTPDSHALVYVLKAGICADVKIVSGVLPVQQMDEFLREDFKTEARFGFVRVALTKQWTSTPQESHRLLQSVLQIQDQAELTRRLSLGMHRLTDDEYRAILSSLP